MGRAVGVGLGMEVGLLQEGVHSLENTSLKARHNPISLECELFQVNPIFLKLTAVNTIDQYIDQGLPDDLTRSWW